MEEKYTDNQVEMMSQEAHDMSSQDDRFDLKGEAFKGLRQFGQKNPKAGKNMAGTAFIGIGITCSYVGFALLLS